MGIQIIGADSYTYEEFERVLALYWQGGFARTVDSEFPLSQASEAHRRMETADVSGRILLKPWR
jgi:D-arabinose 1-dehydrogenase-like Zn-dependent alcohol dehydrogenase